VRQGDMYAVRMALESGADIDVRTERGETALMQAVDSGRVEMARWLLDHGADPNATTEIGHGPLHRAVNENNAQLVALLIERGANVQAENKWGKTPLLRASLNQRTEIVSLLTQAGAAVSITEAALLSDTGRVYEFLNGGTPASFANEAGMTPLMAASRRGDLTLIRELLARGANLEARDRQGYTALTWAVTGAEREAAALLLDRGADINARDDHGRTIAEKALVTQSVDILRMVLEHGAPTRCTNPVYPTLVHQVVYLIAHGLMKDWEPARIVIAFCDDLDEESFDAGTPLLAALKADAPLDVIESLLQHGADPNGRVGSVPTIGRRPTPLMVAAGRGRADCVGLLLDTGADPNGGEDLDSALSLAEEKGRHAVVALLRARGASDEGRQQRLGISDESAAIMRRVKRAKPEDSPKSAAQRAMSLDFRDMRRRMNEERRKRRKDAKNDA
jgi:ankyrin repeat protein